jgi:hypothetical protein
MNTKRLFISLVMLICLFASGCAALTPVNPTPVNPMDRFTGTWTGTMSFSDDPNHKGDVDFVILGNCSKPGSPCGDFFDNTVPCILAVNLVDVRGDVLEYEFGLSFSLDDSCLDSGRGTLTLQADGTLLREHTTAGVTASGMLKRK